MYEIKQISDYIFVDNDLKEAIMMRHIEPLRSMEAEERVQAKLKNYLISSTFNNIKILRVYGYNGFEMSFGDYGEGFDLDNRKIKNSPWYKAALEDTAKTLWAGMHESFSKESGMTPKYSISLFRAIKDQYYKDNIGVIYISLEPEVFSKLADSFKTKSEIYILDNHNSVVNNPKSKVSKIR